MIKHTPGPWAICDNRVDVYSPETDITGSDHICAPDFGEAMANARLIAMAPDLLSLVKKMVPLLGELVRDSEGNVGRVLTLQERAARVIDKIETGEK